MDLGHFAPDDIKNMFEEAQSTSGSHVKYSTLLKKALEKDEELLSEFTTCLYAILVHDYKAKSMCNTRIINFLCMFCKLLKPVNEADSDNPILQHIFEVLVEFSDLENDSCRYWSCLLINKIIDNLEEISDDLFEKIRDAMMDRLKDSKAFIRMQAITSLHRFQDVSDPGDTIILQLCSILNSDFNAKVRQLSLEHVALTKFTLPHVLNRLRDVDVHVRLAAFQKISTKAKYLKISQKRMVLTCGMHDSDEKIRKFVSSQLVENWLEAYGQNYLDLMQAVRLDACYKDIEQTVDLAEFLLNSLFATKHVKEITAGIKLNEAKLIDYEDLNWETILYYRIMVQFFRRSGELEDALDSVLPELVPFCNYIKGYCDFMSSKKVIERLQYHFTLKQLFMITYDYDFGDKASRDRLNSLAHHMLQNTNLTVDVAEKVVKNLEKTIPNIKERSIFVCEIISNILYGEEAIDYEEMQKEELERRHMIQQLKGEVMALRDREDQCIIERRFADAQEIKNEIERRRLELKNLELQTEKAEVGEQKTDIPTLIKCLTVAEAILLSPSVSELTPALATLNKELIEKMIVHEDREVKAKAFKCYSLVCLVNKKCACYGIHIFSAPIFSSGEFVEEPEIKILIICIQAVVDLLILYGLNLVEELDEGDLSESIREDERKVFIGGTSLTDLLHGLANLLEHEDRQVQEAATEGVCSLLLDGRIISSSLFSRIILKWANPATDNEKLKQFIGFALNRLPQLPKTTAYFADGVLSTIRTLVHAPRNSPLSEVNIENIIKFMVTLCQMSPKESEISKDLALKICSQMLDKPRHKVNFMFTKTLLLLTIPKIRETLEDLLQMCDQLRDVIRINQVNKNIVKYNALLTEKISKMFPVDQGLGVLHEDEE